MGIGMEKTELSKSDFRFAKKGARELSEWKAVITLIKCGI